MAGEFHTSSDAEKHVYAWASTTGEFTLLSEYKFRHELFVGQHAMLTKEIVSWIFDY